MLSPTYLGYITKELIPKMLDKNTSEEEVMKKLGLSTKDEYTSTIIMMRQVGFTIKYLIAAIEDMKINHYYNI